MTLLFSNGPLKDFVINPFNKLIYSSSRLFLAAPYFTLDDQIVQAAEAGKSICLLVGLNSSTCPKALRNVYGRPNIAVRYFTNKFHAKIYVFDDAALVGSSNLTNGGLFSNREAVIYLDQSDNPEAVEEVRGLFLELWESAQVLINNKLELFERAFNKISRDYDPDKVIKDEVGRAEPYNINVASQVKTKERVFLESLRRQVYEQYLPNFNEVSHLIEENKYRRDDLSQLHLAHEANRFLNWVRLTYVVGDEAWQSAHLLSQEERRNKVVRLAKEWVSTRDNKVPETYIDWLGEVRKIFGTSESIKKATEGELINGLMSIHAFLEQLRFVKGGAANLPKTFLAANGNNIEKIKNTLSYLVHGSGDFIQRLHDVLYSPNLKLAHFGKFSALELYGTLKPRECPPMNSRMAKALRYLGYDVPVA